MKSASSRLLLTPATFERWDVVAYAKPGMSSRERNTAEEKNKAEYFSRSDDKVELLLNVTVDFIFT